jgi:hypothetical protein
LVVGSSPTRPTRYLRLIPLARTRAYTVETAKRAPGDAIQLRFANVHFSFRIITEEIMMTRLTKTLVALTMFACGPLASAAVIFDNGIIANNGFVSDPDFTGTPKFSADDFTLAAGANVINDVHWTGLYAFSNTPLTDNFTIQFYNNSGDFLHLPHFSRLP